MASINIGFDKITGKMAIKVEDLNPLEVAKLCLMAMNESLNRIHAMTDEPKIVKPNIGDIAKCDATKN